jgi:hypothetical protein
MSNVNGVGGSNQVFNPGLDGAQDVGDVGSTKKTQGTGGVNVESPHIDLGGNNTGVAYSRPSPLQSSNLVLPSSITDSTNVDITACLVLLMQTAVQMRRDQREQWVVQAQNALETSNTAADLQIEAAKAKLIADCVTTGVQAAVSVASCAVSVGEAAASSSASKKISSQADALYGTDADIKASGTKGGANDADADIDIQAKSIIGKEGLTGDSLGGETASLGESGTQSAQKSAAKMQEAQVERAETKQATTDIDDTKASNKAADVKSEQDIKDQMRAKKEFMAQSMSVESASLQARSKALSAALDVVSSGAKMVGSGLTYQADLDSAMAAKVKALADFQNTAANEQLDFANELRDYTNAILSTIKDVESARHAASNAIANI